VNGGVLGRRSDGGGRAHEVLRGECSECVFRGLLPAHAGRGDDGFSRATRRI
jgi:hypothetical protein